MKSNVNFYTLKLAAVHLWTLVVRNWAMQNPTAVNIGILMLFGLQILIFEADGLQYPSERNIRPSAKFVRAQSGRCGTVFAMVKNI